MTDLRQRRGHQPASFGPKELRSLFGSNKLRVLPDQQLRWLCDGVNRLRERLAAVPASATIPDDVRKGTAAEAADLLAKVVRQLRDTRSDHDPERDRRLTSLQMALFDAREFLDAPARPVRSPVRWHEPAVQLAQSYSYAVEIAGRPRLGVSNTGPVPRFVVAMLPFVTGEAAPTLDAVAKHLKRERTAAAPASAKTSPMNEALSPEEAAFFASGGDDASLSAEDKALASAKPLAQSGKTGTNRSRNVSRGQKPKR